MMKKIITMILNIKRLGRGGKYKIGKIDDTEFIYQILNSEDMMNNGILVAGSVMRGIAGPLEAKIVLIDENFDRFNDECKKFIIYHELGHLTKHFTDEILSKYHTLNYYDKLLLEHEADMFGVENTSVEACLKTLELLNVLLDEKGFKDKAILDRKLLLKARTMKMEEE